MPRRQAQALLDDLISRAIAVNEDPGGAFFVNRISVFGSFADPSRGEVGDVDVQVQFDRRVEGDEFIERAQAAADEAERAGRATSALTSSA
jgi:predicted nucleotidyltransferase